MSETHDVKHCPFCGKSDVKVHHHEGNVLHCHSCQAKFRVILEHRPA